MTYLAAIVKGLENDFNITINSDYYHKTIINGVRFLNDSDISATHLTPNILYLADYKKMKNTTVYGTVLYVCCNGEKSHNATISIDEDINLIDIYNSISDVIQSHNLIEQKKNILYSDLHSGTSLDKILKEAYNVIDSPIVLLDTSYTVLAFYPQIIDDYFFDTKGQRKTLNIERITKMEETKITELIQHSVYPFIVDLEDMPCPCVFESIRIKHSVVGYIFVRCSHKKLSDDELDYVHVLTQAISIQLQKDDTYSNPYGIKYELFFKDLFLNHYDNETDIKNDLKKLGIQPKKYYFFVTCGLIEQQTKIVSSTYYCMQLNSIFDNSINHVHGNYFATLISTDEFNEDSSINLLRFESFLKLNKMKGATSYLFENLLDAPIFYEQALNHLKYKLTRYDENPIEFYSDYFLTHLVLSSTNSTAVNASIHPSILQMKKYDEVNNTEYLKTLRTYIAQNRNAPATAKALFIHKSTLFYRFSKMETLFKIELNNPDLLFAYEYSIKLLKIFKSDY